MYYSRENTKHVVLLFGRKSEHGEGCYRLVETHQVVHAIDERIVSLIQIVELILMA